MLPHGCPDPWGAVDVLGVDHRQRLPVVGGMGSAVLLILVLDDLTQILRQILDSTGNLNRKKVRIPPCVDPGLSREDLEQASLGGCVRGYGDSSLRSYNFEYIIELMARQVRGGVP